MFDKLLKTKFYTKSKSAIKLTKIRIGTIKRKRNAMQKYLKNDIADLLENHLDVNAYGRVEGLWNELNLSSCYDFVDKFCTHISSNLTTMDEERECPDECREAASTLMYATATFSDLPELRDLRNVFIKRYGSSIEYYANKEFISKVKSTAPPTKDMKLQLIQDIATEKGVEWNVKRLEQKLFNQPVFDKENRQDIDERNNAVHNMNEMDADYKFEDPRKYPSHVVEIGYFSTTTKEFHEEEKVTEPPKDNQVVDKTDTKEQMSSSAEEDVDMKPFYYKTISLPSYNKSKISNIPAFPSKDDMHQCDSITEAKTTKPKSVRTRNQKAPLGQDSIDSSDTRKYVLEPFPRETASNRGVNVKDDPPLRSASLPANSKAVEATKRYA